MQLQSSVRKAMATTNMKPIFLLIVATLIPLCHSASVLGAGGALATGQSLTNCRFRFAMQSLCNLVLLDGNTVIWSSGTDRIAANCYVTMQRDGNLVVYNYNSRAMWASNTNRATAAYYLSLQCDGNLVIYTPGGTAIWATGTNRRLNGVMANGTTSTTSTKSPGGKV
ncbi:hypothetical protein ACHQM5_028832 [Ranunculus cassubicifolius]